MTSITFILFVSDLLPHKILGTCMKFSFFFPFQARSSLVCALLLLLTVGNWKAESQCWSVVMCICNQTSWKCIKWFKFNREYHPDFVIILYRVGIQKHAIFPQFLFPVSYCGHNGGYTNVMRNVLNTARKCRVTFAVTAAL